MKRRQFLKLVPTLALPVSMRLCGKGKSEPLDETIAQLAVQLASGAQVEAIVRSYMNQYPNERDIAKLKQLLNPRRFTSSRDLATAIAGSSLDDFRFGRVVFAGDWMLSRTEARLLSYAHHSGVDL
jgi:hypothetical protein